jgi:hypothetical protein
VGDEIRHPVLESRGGHGGGGGVVVGRVGSQFERFLAVLTFRKGWMCVSQAVCSWSCGRGGGMPRRGGREELGDS